MKTAAQLEREFFLCLKRLEKVAQKIERATANVDESCRVLCGVVNRRSRRRT